MTGELPLSSYMVYRLAKAPPEGEPPDAARGRSVARSGSKVLLGFLKVRPDEASCAFLYLAYLLFAVGVVVLGRNVAAALFLSTHGSAALPWMYFASAVVVSLAAWSYGRVTGKVRLDNLITITLVAFIVILVAMRAAMWFDLPLAFPALYVVVELMGALLIIQFWSLATATHHTREAKRLFGFIGAGGVLASIVVGFGGAGLVHLTGTENLIFLMVLCLVACLVLVRVLGNRGRGQLAQSLDDTGRSARRRSSAISKQTLKVFGSRHLRLVAIIVALTFVVTTLVDYQFKTLAHRSFEKEALTAFFSLLYGFTGIIALFVQLFLTGRVLERFGVLVALSILPLSLLLGSAAIFVAPLAIVAAFAKGSDGVFRYSVNDVTLQLLYLPVPPQSRMKAKAFIDGMLKPLAYGSTGLALALVLYFLPAVDERVHWLGLFSASAAALWLLFVARLRGEYLRSLVNTLHKRRLDLDDARVRLDGDSAEAVLGAALTSLDEAEVVRALDLLSQVESRVLEQKVASLLEHASPRVRRAAVSHLGRWGSLQWADDVQRLFDDHDGAVRAAAIDAYCAIGREKAVRAVGRFLEDEDPLVRAATVSGMIRRGGLDGILASTETLEDMISSPVPSLRRHGAKALGDTGLRAFYQQIVTLLGDEDLAVQRQAIAAAGRIRSPELVPSLVHKLGHPDLGGNAADALVCYGAAIEDALAKVLDHETENPAVRLGAPGVLGRLGTQRASEILTKHVCVEDENLRTRVCRWLNRLHTRFPVLRVDHKEILRAVEAEIRTGYDTLALLEALKLDGAPLARGGLLVLALEERIQRLVDRLFLLLALRFPRRTTEAVRAGLESPSKAVRGNALEVLENTLDRAMRSKILPLLDERPRGEKLAAFRSLYGATSTPSRSAALAALVEEPSPWVRACALFYLSAVHEAPDDHVARIAMQMTRSSSPLVREVALLACYEHLSTSEAAPLVEEALLDADRGVRAVAASLESRTDRPRGPSEALAV